MPKIPGVTVSLTAAVDLAKHLFVGFDGNPCAAGAKALGVVDVETDAGDEAPVVVSGKTLVKLGAGVVAGAALASDATGKAVTATALSAVVPTGAVAVLSSGAEPAMTLAGGVLPQAVNGYAMEDGDSDDVIEVLLA